MTGPGRPVRQPANTRASVLLTCFGRLAAFPCMPDSIASLPGSFPAAAPRSGGRIVRAAGSAYTAAPGNWAPASRPVRAVGGVYTGRRYDSWCGRKVRTMVTADLLSRARAGDGEAFRELVESHRRKLQVHCYRMLGSFADAEDAVQETMLAAWQGIGGFAEERASLRTWLYKIATSRCLNARRAASRRPARKWDVSQFQPPVPTPRDEAVWLQPFPDALLEGAAGGPPGPEARYEQGEAISLAFVAALQLLPPRQVAVLILRDG